jgi:catechol 2,3-dioxygenase-like lactoylglutathione lyase family enzyme
MQSTITHLFAGVPVSNLDASIDWYTRFFGRPPDLRVGEEMLWEIDEHATLFIEPNAARAGAGRITLAVAGLDALLERLAAQRIEHEPIETYSNGVPPRERPRSGWERDRVRRATRRRERVASLGRNRVSS